MTHIYVIFDPVRGMFYAGPKSLGSKEWNPDLTKAKWYKRSCDAANAIGYELGYSDERFKQGQEYEVCTYQLVLQYESTKKILKKS